VLWTDKGAFAVSLTTLLVLGVALLFAWLQVKAARNTVQVQLIADLSRRWDEQDVVESRKRASYYADGQALLKAFQEVFENHPDDYYILIRVPNFFENLEVLVEEGAISLDVVEKLLGSPAVYWWKRWEASVKYLREAHDQPTAYEKFEDLAANLIQLKARG